MSELYQIGNMSMEDGDGSGHGMVSNRYTVKESPETFPDWNWIAPCIPAGYGFIREFCISEASKHDFRLI